VTIGVRFQAGGKGIFSLRHHVQTGSGARPASCLTDTGFLSSGKKRPDREADHSPPSSAKVNMWNHTSTPPYILAKHRNNLTFYLSSDVLSQFRSKERPSRLALFCAAFHAND
jgi:hypothetical protein